MSEYRASLFRDEAGAPAAEAAPALDRLRAEVARIERGGAAQEGGGGPGVAFGWPSVDRAFPEGALAAGAVHELTGGAAGRLALALLARLAGPVLWCHPARRAEALYGPGLANLGAGLVERLLIARARSRGEGLWAAEEGLRSGALDAVVLEPDGPLDLTASRRLQLAAETGGALGLVLPGGAEAGALAPSALFSRWRAVPLPSDVSGPCTRRRIELALLRRRGGGAGRWVLEGEPAS